MEAKIRKVDWVFLVLCLGLGLLAEESFFRGKIGISYFVFIVGFYSVFFWRYRKFSFSHQRLGYLIICCIWLLSASYFLNDNLLFYVLNIVVIPALVVFHLTLITSPRNLRWNQLRFISYLASRLLEALKFNFGFASLVGKQMKTGVDEDHFIVWKKILIGIVISLPVLYIVLNLLVAADSQFERVVGGIPQWFDVMSFETFMRCMIVLFCTAAFFGFLQILLKKQIKVIQQSDSSQMPKLDSVISVTVLVLINAVYLLFTVVQFKYFFSGSLQGDFTYAEYARKGFFELLFVTLINLSITVVVLTFVNQVGNTMKKVTQILLTILVLASAVMLCSAFLRLSMYEDAYGFTFIRVLVHSFMIFLSVIFTYTFLKIWIEKLSLVHFYFISALIYYTTITVIDLDKIVVKENIDRYQTSGKIDTYYLNQLSYTGVLGLIDLYKKEGNIQNLKTLLLEQRNKALIEDYKWQSYNLKREQAIEQLKKLN